MSMLNERFNDALDDLNDALTDLCEAPFSDIITVVNNVENADVLLRAHGLHIDFGDFEQIRAGVEGVDPDEAITFLIPLYKEDHDQSEYNLRVIYFYSTDSEDEIYEMDMELQYVWENDDESDFDLTDSEYDD